MTELKWAKLQVGDTARVEIMDGQGGLVCVTDDNHADEILAREYTYEHLEAAACMWEHVLDALRRHREKRNPWDEYREAYGMAALRATVIRHAPTLETAYQAAQANGYDKGFDWEYVPKYMEDHVTRILT